MAVFDLQVNYEKYHDACVNDACACDTGGDCECVCGAIAAYAAACLSAGVCIDWRKPDFCRKSSVLPAYTIHY